MVEDDDRPKTRLGWLNQAAHRGARYMRETIAERIREEDVVTPAAMRELATEILDRWIRSDFEFAFEGDHGGYRGHVPTPNEDDEVELAHPDEEFASTYDEMWCDAAREQLKATAATLQKLADALEVSRG